MKKWLLLPWLLGTHLYAATLEEIQAADERGDYVQAYQWVKPLAAGGDAAAQYDLGWRLESGRGIVQDLPAALYWYEQAMQNGLESAQTAWGELEDLADPDVDALFAQAISGDVVAMQTLADIYERGHHAPYDGQKARHWREQAQRALTAMAAQGDGQAQYQLGELLRTREPERALQLLQQADIEWKNRAPGQELLLRQALAESAQALNDNALAQRYLQQWAQQEASGGNAALGLFYAQQGQYDKALPLLEKSDTRAAWYTLGTFYEQGLGVARDAGKAQQYYEKAAEFAEVYEKAAILWGNGADPWLTRAEYRLGQLADARQPSQAYSWYAQAAARGHGDAQYRLALHFAANEDELSALYWLEQAAANLHHDALVALAGRYQQGQGVAQDADKAAAFLARSRYAEQNPVP